MHNQKITRGLDTSCSFHLMPFRSFQWSFLIFFLSSILNEISFFHFSPFLLSALPFCPTPLPLFFPSFLLLEHMLFLYDLQLLTLYRERQLQRENLVPAWTFYVTLGAVCSFGIFWIKLKRQCVYWHLVCSRLPDYNVIPRVWRLE